MARLMKLTLTVTNRDWMVHAPCRGQDNLFFPPSSRHVSTIEAAQAICATCPVFSECSQYAEEMNVSYGVWAGEFIDVKNFKTVRELSPCGTQAAYARHLRRKERPCERCKAANTLRNTERAEMRKTK